QVVLLSLFSRIGGLNQIEELVRLFERYGPLAQREIILAAARGGAAAWISSLKSSYVRLDAWSRRAVIQGAMTMPKDEREYWLRLIKQSASPLEKIVIDAVRAA